MLNTISTHLSARLGQREYLTTLRHKGKPNLGADGRTGLRRLAIMLLGVVATVFAFGAADSTCPQDGTKSLSATTHIAKPIRFR